MEEHQEEQLSGLVLGNIPSFLFLFVSFAVFYFLLYGFLPTTINTLDVDASLITQRLLNSPHGISYEDPITHRVYTHIIDATKINQAERITRSISYGEKNAQYAAKISINNDNFYYNKELFLRWRPLATKPVLWGPKTSLSTQRMSVLLKQEEHLIPVKLTIEVVAQP